MKKLFVIAAVAALTLALAPVALGAPGGKKLGKVVFTANGKVTAVDAAGETFTMRVWSGSRVRQERNKDIDVNVTAKTKIWRVVMGRAVVVALGDVKAGERVWTKGTFATSNGTRTYTATRVRLKATWPFMAKGIVVDDGVDVANGTLTVKITKSMKAMRSFLGEEVVFAAVKSTVIKKRISGKYRRIALDAVEDGNKVTISGRVDNREPTAMQFVAKKVLVR